MSLRLNDITVEVHVLIYNYPECVRQRGRVKRLCLSIHLYACMYLKPGIISVRLI